MNEWLTEAGEWLSSTMGIAILGTLLALGVLAAVIAYLLGEWGERRQRKRELKGLLRILDIEIAGNKRQLQIFEEYPTWIAEAPDHSLQTKAWEDARTRLAYLLNNHKQFDDIARYYWNIQEIERYRLDSTGAETSEENRQTYVTSQLRLLLKLSDTARGHIRKYIAPLQGLEDPESREPMPPSSSSRRQVRETSSPWWKRLFGHR
jgi:hypothetical protein